MAKKLGTRMTKKDTLFKFAKEVALLQYRIMFCKDSILEGEEFNDTKRIESEIERMTGYSNEVRGITRLGEQFNFNADDIFLIANNLRYEFTFEEIEQMEKSPY